MRYLLAVALSALLLGCGHSKVLYQPQIEVDMNKNKAVKIIEQSFYEDFGKGKVEAVEVTDEAIILYKGVITNSKGSASALAIGSGALGSSKSISKTMHDSQRIYLNSLGDMKLQQSNKNSKNYAVSIFMQDGSLAKHVFFRDEVKAKRFINAMEYLKTDYNYTL